MASRWHRSNCIKITGSSVGGAVSRMSAATEPDLTRDDKAGVATAPSDYTTTGRVRCFRAVVVSGLECASTTIHLCSIPPVVVGLANHCIVAFDESYARHFLVDLSYVT